MEDEIQRIADEQLELIQRITSQAVARKLGAKVKKDLQMAASMTMQVSAQPTVRRKLHMLTQGAMYLGKAKAGAENA
jgi:hypothetical protein